MKASDELTSRIATGGTSVAAAFDDEDEYRPAPVVPALPAWADGSLRIGIHTSIAGDLAGSLDTARKLGGNALQIFSGSPRMWPRPGQRIPEPDAARFRARRAELGLGPVVIHANYLINLATGDPVMRVRTIQAFHDEMVRAAAIGADYLVVHPGAACGASSEEAVRLVGDALKQAARGIRLPTDFGDLTQSGVRVLLENTAGQGSCIGMRFAELRAILDLAANLPLGVCVDTAHAFAAGYDLRTADGLERMLDDLDSAVGLARVPVVHVNDSKTALGSRVDLHQHIGKGEIGSEAFARILTHPRLRGRAFLLETPIDSPGDDRRNVRALWDLAGVAVQQAPEAEDGFSMLRTERKNTPAPRATKVDVKATPRAIVKKAKKAKTPRSAKTRAKSRGEK